MQILEFKIWDKYNKQWLEPMALFFGKENSIWKVSAKKPNEDALSDGWYDLVEKDLKKIEFVKPTGLKVKDGSLLYDGSIFYYQQHPKYLLGSFYAIVVWVGELGCYGYEHINFNLKNISTHTFPSPFAEHDELQTDILNHCQIIGSIQEHPKFECVRQHSI